MIQVYTNLASNSRSCSRHVVQQVYERIRAEGLSDRVVVVNAVQETSVAISALVTDHGISGVAAMTCALLNSLTQLTSARLVVLTCIIGKHHKYVS